MRYAALDAARGLALAGVALVNGHAIAVGWDSHRAIDRVGHALDLVFELAVGLLVQGRALALLAFLFGFGLWKQWQKAAEEGEASTLRAIRARLGALFILGLVHGLLLWPGDIVSSYALLGLLATLLLRRPRGQRILFGLALTVWLLSTAFFVLFYQLAEPETLPPSPSSFAETSLVTVLWAHLIEFWQYGLVHATLPPIWVSFLAGLVLAPRLQGWLEAGAPWNRWITTALLAHLAAIGFDLVGLAQGAWIYELSLHPGHAWFLLAHGAATLSGPALLIWLGARLAEARSGYVLRELALAAGRTPLTQFFGQSLLFFLIFAKVAIGWHGEIGRAAYSATALLIWGLLAAFARAWLAAGHTRGPAERVWMGLAGWLARKPRQALS